MISLVDLLKKDVDAGKIRGIPVRSSSESEKKEFYNWMNRSILYLVEENGGVFRKYEFRLLNSYQFRKTKKRFSDGSYLASPEFAEIKKELKKLPLIVLLRKNFEIGTILPQGIRSSQILYSSEEKVADFLEDLVDFKNSRRGNRIARLKEPYFSVMKYGGIIQDEDISGLP